MAFLAINAGQRNVNVESKLVALTTNGGFRLTGPAAKVLGIKPTDNVMFFYDEESKQWAIGKGYAKMKNDGTPQLCAARVNKAALVESQFDEVYKAAMESENEELIAALSAEGISHEEIVAILAKTISVDDVQDYEGSKCASPSGFTGVGANVTFTDSNIWKSLKADMENPESLNREFAIDTDAVFTIPAYNGYETVDVLAVILGDYVDVEPQRRGKSEDAE